MDAFVLRKMKVADGSPIQYKWDAETVENASVNALIGKEISISFSGKIVCEGCGKITRKSFAQGYCYDCFQTHPATEECVLRPELCRAQFGEARDMEWATRNHLAPHFVYLAFSSNIKVGITRRNQIPTRWIDQGALQAIKCLEVPNRHVAGVAEVFLKQFYSDKSAWQRMLQTNSISWDINLADEKKAVLEKLPAELQKYSSGEDELFHFEYPTGKLENKLVAESLDKQAKIDGKLTGIKGQYLIFDYCRVFNVRKHTGYEVELKINE